MIAFLIGGEGRFMDAMINKLNKDGHRVYLLTGTKTVIHPTKRYLKNITLNMTVTVSEKFL